MHLEILRLSSTSWNIEQYIGDCTAAVHSRLPTESCDDHG